MSNSNETTPSLFSKDRISVLVPAWNERDTISTCIKSFTNIAYPNKELVIIAGGADSTFEIAKKYASKDIIVLEQEPLGKNAALNKGLKHVSGEIIVLTDADCIMSNEWFESLIQPLISENEDATTGSNKPLASQLNNPFILYQYAFTIFGSSNEPKYKSSLDGKCAAVKRSVLEKLGGFDPNVRTGTDFDLGKRLTKYNFKIRFIGDSVIETNYPSSFSEYIRQKSRWLRNNFIHGKRYKDAKEVQSVTKAFAVGILMTLTLPIFVLLFGLVPIFIWLSIFSLGQYNRIKLIKFSGNKMRNLNFKPVYLRLPVYTIVDYLGWTLGLIELILPWRRLRW